MLRKLRLRQKNGFLIKKSVFLHPINCGRMTDAQEFLITHVYIKAILEQLFVEYHRILRFCFAFSDI